MRRFFLAAAALLVAAPLLAACAGGAGALAPGTAISGPLAGTEADETALGLAEASYELAGRTYQGLVETGVVARGSAAAVRVADIDLRIQPMLELARSARAAGDGASLEQATAALGPLVLELVTAVNSLKGTRQ